MLLAEQMHQAGGDRLIRRDFPKPAGRVNACLHTKLRTAWVTGHAPSAPAAPATRGRKSAARSFDTVQNAARCLGNGLCIHYETAGGARQKRLGGLQTPRAHRSTPGHVTSSIRCRPLNPQRSGGMTGLQRNTNKRRNDGQHITRLRAGTISFFNKAAFRIKAA